MSKLGITVSKAYILTEYIILTMPENTKRVNAFIPLYLDSKITQSGESYTNCITKALTLYFSSQDNPNNQDHNEINQDILQLKESRFQELQNRNEILIKQLNDLQNKEPENKDILKLQELRIQDLQEQIKTKDSQQEARIKDLQDQLKVKDGQLGRLTDTMQAQAVQLQTILNQKAIEAPGAKKPWWQFW